MYMWMCVYVLVKIYVNFYLHATVVREFNLYDTTSLEFLKFCFMALCIDYFYNYSMCAQKECVLQLWNAEFYV